MPDGLTAMPITCTGRLAATRMKLPGPWDTPNSWEISLTMNRFAGTLTIALATITPSLAKRSAVILAARVWMFWTARPAGPTSRSTIALDTERRGKSGTASRRTGAFVVPFRVVR